MRSSCEEATSFAICGGRNRFKLDKLPPPLIRMLAALEDDPAFGPKTVAPLRGALRLLDGEAEGNFDALCALQVGSGATAAAFHNRLVASLSPLAPYAVP
jgi:hypothetical protein